MRPKGVPLGAVPMLVSFVVLLGAAPAVASTYVVNSNSDFSDATPGNDICGVVSNCSLRAAIEESNAHAGPDTIQLPANSYAMGATAPEVDSQVTILGAGSASTTLSRGAPGRVLSVGPSGVLDLRNVKVTGGSVGGEGAGIQSSGVLTVRGSVITGNDAIDQSGGGIAIASSAGTTLIEDSTISLNEAGGSVSSVTGGGIDQRTGAGKLTIDGSAIESNQLEGADPRGAAINAGGELEVLDSSITANTATIDSPTIAYGGGMTIAGGTEAVSIRRSSITDNVSADADMGFVENALFFGGPTSIVDSTIAGNTEPPTAPSGRLMLINGGGPLTIRRSTISGNLGRISTLVTSTVENSTLTGSAAGGALDVSGADVEVRTSTIAGNTGPGLWSQDFIGGAAITVSGSIVSGQTNNCLSTGASTITSGGGNVEDDDDCGFTATNDLVDTDPLLGPLAADGGPTETRAIPASSPAVDNFAAGCPPPTTDQRGKARPQGSACDSGAYEFDTPAAVTIETGPSGTTADPTPVFTFSANEPVSGAECRLLGAATEFSSCTSPVQYGPLPNGDYTFEVRVIDSDGNPSPTASRAFIVAAPGPGPGPTITLDTTVQDPDVSAKKTQKLKKKVKVKIKAGAQEPVELVGKGRITVKKRRGGKGGEKNRGKGRGKSFSLKTVRKSTDAGEQTVLRLKPTKNKDSKRILRLLEKGKDLRANPSVELTDEVGNSVIEKRVVRLKLKKRRKG